jgi:dynamin 1-like protein
MQKDIKPIHLPDMPTYMRAQNEDPGQSSPRSQLETHIIKSLIVSYFNTVRKSMNDMVPKTIMAFLVNKTKNMAQKQLVAALYNDNVDLKQLLSEDNATVKKREACQEMVSTLRMSLEFLNEVRDFYFESDSAY